MANPLAPLPPEPMLKPKKPEADARVMMRRILWPMAGATLIGIAVGSMPLLMVGVIVWTGWAVYYVLLTRVLDPRGEDTPYVNQHSEIQAMVMRGDAAGAARAYRGAIAAEPGNVVACEQLAQLALRELKDYETAVWAYHQAEQRGAEPRRRAGYALLAVGICRDNIGDRGRTIVELRKFLERYPDAPNADHLRAELAELKARHFEAS